MKGSLYNSNYFERGIESGVSLYTNYRWLPELTIPFCFRLIEVLSISSNDVVLDFGCAKGFMVKGLRLLYRKAYGVDISEYAVEHSPEDVREYVRHINTVDDVSDCYDLVIAKDVLEHVPVEEIDHTLKVLRSISNRLFCIMPLGDGKMYNFREYELDTTHVIRQTHEWWIDSFTRAGFCLDFFAFRIEGMKERCMHARGNGFFYLR